MSRIWTFILRGIKEFCNAIILVMTSVILLQITLRYLFGRPLLWPEELARFALIWTIFLMAPVLASQNKHLTIDILDKSLKPPWDSIRKILIRLIVIGFLLFVFLQSVNLVPWFIGIASPAMKAPMTLYYGILMVSVFLMVIEYCIQLFHEIKKLNLVRRVKRADRA